MWQLMTDAVEAEAGAHLCVQGHLYKKHFALSIWDGKFTKATVSDCILIGFCFDSLSN